MEVKILGSVWFTPMQSQILEGNIGIVLVDTGYEEKAYIGLGKGADQKDDEILISKFGGPFPLKQAKELI